MSVRNRILPAGNQRVFGATVIAGVMLFGVACHNGVETPISPSTTTEFVPAATSAALDDGGDTATTRGGPMSYVMSGSSGMSGTCTLGSGGAGFRMKASGQGGVPGQELRLFLWVAPTATDPDEGPYTDFAQVDDRGNFRFSGERVTFISSGRTGTCQVTPRGSMTALAESQPFTIP
jgi:hypothetical protein